MCLPYKLDPPFARFGRGHWTIYDRRLADLLYEDFVEAEARRLGVKGDDSPLVWCVVAPDRSAVEG